MTTIKVHTTFAILGLAIAIVFSITILGLLQRNDSAYAYSYAVLPDGEIAHIVAEANPSLPLVHDGDRTQTIRIELWLHQLTGNGTLTMHDGNTNTLISALERTDTTTREYTAQIDSEIVYQTSMTDEAILNDLFGYFARYRWWLESGIAVSFGEEIRNGQRTLKIQHPIYTDDFDQSPDTVYLDPETFFPIEIQYGGGGSVHFTYTTIESFDANSAPTPPLIDWPSPTLVEYHINLSPNAIVGFDRYPLHYTGDTFKEYSLSLVQHYYTTGQRSHSTDIVYFHYTTEAEDDLLTVAARGPLLAEERTGLEEALKAGALNAESVTVEGIPTLLTVEPDGQVRLLIEHPTGVTYIWAPDRGTAFQVANTLESANPSVSFN